MKTKYSIIVSIILAVGLILVAGAGSKVAAQKYKVGDRVEIDTNQTSWSYPDSKQVWQTGTVTEVDQRAGYGALILMTAVGVPMIWMGDEFGENVPKTEHSNKINWNLLESESNKELLEYYKNLIELRKSHAAFYAATCEFFHEDPDSRVISFNRFDHDSNNAVIVLNLSDRDLENYTIQNFPLTGECIEWTSKNKMTIDNNSLTTNLARREGTVFVNI